MNKEEYCGKKAPVCFQKRDPFCPAMAIIPTKIVDTMAEVKGLVNCVVKVIENNNVYYIDDKHRISLVSSNPTEHNNYDFVNNPLDLRAQLVFDYAGAKVAYYDAAGNLFTLAGAPGSQSAFDVLTGRPKYNGVPMTSSTDIPLVPDEIDTNMLADNAVTSDKISAGAVVADKVADSAIVTSKIADDAVTSGKIADNAVTADKLASGAVTSGKIANGDVTSDKLGNESVITAKIADGAVTSNKIADGTIDTEKFADSSLTSDKIQDNAVITSKIANGNVTTVKLTDEAVTAGKIANAAVTLDKIADDSVSAAKIQANAVTNGKLANGAVTTSKIADGAVTVNKLESGTVEKFLNGGKNIAAPYYFKYKMTLDVTGGMVAQYDRCVYYKIPVEESTEYSISCATGYLIGSSTFWYGADGVYISTSSSSDWASSKTVTSVANARYVSFVVKRSDDGSMTPDSAETVRVQVEKGSVATTYEDYIPGYVDETTYRNAQYHAGDVIPGTSYMASGKASNSQNTFSVVIPLSKGVASDVSNVKVEWWTYNCNVISLNSGQISWAGESTGGTVTGTVTSEGVRLNITTDTTIGVTTGDFVVVYIYCRISFN